jgi:hypothetical protein
MQPKWQLLWSVTAIYSRLYNIVINEQQHLQSGSWPMEMQDENYPNNLDISLDNNFKRIYKNLLKKAFFDKKYIEKLWASSIFR